MAEIPTMTGPVSPDQLGIVLLHEYLLYGLHGWQYAPEVEYDRAAVYERIHSLLRQFKEMGGKTIVDASGITLGRNVTLYAELAQATGVQIVATTGFDGQPTSIPGHFSAYGSLYRKTSDPHQHHWHREISGHFYPSHGSTKDYLMFLFYNELTEGMAAPGMIRSKIPAGLIKAASSWSEITVIEDLSLRGAGMAAKRAGVAVYTDCINQAQQQMKILLEEKLEPERIVIGNCDDGRAIDLERDKDIARKGACVAYDHIGWEDASFPRSIPDDQRVELIHNMVRAGYTEHIVLSCSTIAYALGVAPPGHSFAHLLKSFVPKLKKAGVSENAINIILVENPRRILSNS